MVQGIHIIDSNNTEYVIWKEDIHPKPKLQLWENKNITPLEKDIVKNLIIDAIDIINKLVKNGERTFDEEFGKINYLRNCLQELENFKIKIDSITSSEQGEQTEQSKQGEQSDEFIESSEQTEQSDEFIESSEQKEQSDDFIERGKEGKEDEDKKRTT